MTGNDTGLEAFNSELEAALETVEATSDELKPTLEKVLGVRLEDPTIYDVPEDKLADTYLAYMMLGDFATMTAIAISKHNELGRPSPSAAVKVLADDERLEFVARKSYELAVERSLLRDDIPDITLEVMSLVEVYRKIEGISGLRPGGDIHRAAYLTLSHWPDSWEMAAAVGKYSKLAKYHPDDDVAQLFFGRVVRQNFGDTKTQVQSLVGSTGVLPQVGNKRLSAYNYASMLIHEGLIDSRKEYSIAQLDQLALARDPMFTECLIDQSNYLANIGEDDDTPRPYDDWNSRQMIFYISTALRRKIPIPDAVRSEVAPHLLLPFANMDVSIRTLVRARHFALQLDKIGFEFFKDRAEDAFIEAATKLHEQLTAISGANAITDANFRNRYDILYATAQHIEVPDTKAVQAAEQLWG